MNRRANPFRPAIVLTLLLVGGGAFLLFLYALGSGLDGRSERDGGAHAAGNGLNGFAGLAELLERRGYEVSLSRSEGRLEQTDALLVITPQHFADGERIWEVLQARRNVGPTLLILPKWYTAPIPDNPLIDAEKGWVNLGEADSAPWIEELEALSGLEPVIGETAGWRGLGLSGGLPDTKKVQGIGQGAASPLQPLVRDSEGDVLAGYWDNDGYYPVLAEAAGADLPDPDDTNVDEDAWPVVVVLEPDLMNNYGLADAERARLAVAIVDATLEDYDLPVLFDLTIPGLGSSDNLLTLAFRPPFLAATLCLILAAIVISWRSFRRFGPAAIPEPAMAMGKRQLARNAASLVERARRLHLLGPPYAAMMAARIAGALGIREKDPRKRNALIERALAARGLDRDEFAGNTSALIAAHSPGELLRAAGALKKIEEEVS